MRMQRLGLVTRRAGHLAILTTPRSIGSDAWIRTMIQGSKVLCPAIRRRRKSGREDSKPCCLRPPTPEILSRSVTGPD